MSRRQENPVIKAARESQARFDMTTAEGRVAWQRYAVLLALRANRKDGEIHHGSVYAILTGLEIPHLLPPKSNLEYDISLANRHPKLQEKFNKLVRSVVDTEPLNQTQALRIARLFTLSVFGLTPDATQREALTIATNGLTSAGIAAYLLGPQTEPTNTALDSLGIELEPATIALRGRDAIVYAIADKPERLAVPWHPYEQPVRVMFDTAFPKT